jgi:hypothetical protein
MALVDPSLHARSTGSGYIFWVSACTGVDGALGNARVHSRIKPSDVCGNIQYQHAVVFFLESRNLHTIPSQMKGALCAVMLKENETDKLRWRLCICWKYWQEQDCLQIFVWKGVTKPAPFGISGFYPDFFWAQPDRSAPTDEATKAANLQTDRLAFSKMFFPKLIRGSYEKFVFLNQVQGCLRPIEYQGHDQSHKIIRKTNKNDGCYECNPNGPDYHLLPQFASEMSHPPTALFPQNYWTVSQSVLASYLNSGKTSDEYKRTVEEPNLEPIETRAKKEGYHNKKHPPWTAPAVGFCFEGKDLEFETVYVEDTLQRMHKNPSRQSNVVAIPFLETVQK